MRRIYVDRADAGRTLAESLSAWRSAPETVVLALPRGGVPVAYEVATALALPLDVLVVRKLGLPSQPELAMGAIASGGAIVLNRDVLRYLHGGDDALESVRVRETAELMRRERQYRGDQPPLQMSGRTAIVGDDGLATGATMEAAVRSLGTLGVITEITLKLKPQPEQQALLACSVADGAAAERLLAARRAVQDFPVPEGEDHSPLAALPVSLQERTRILASVALIQEFA